MDFKRFNEFSSYKLGEESGFFFGYMMFFTMTYFVLSRFKLYQWNTKIYLYLACALIILYFIMRTLSKSFKRGHMQ